MQIIQIIHKDNSDYTIAKAFYQIPFQDCISTHKLEKKSPFHSVMHSGGKILTDIRMEGFLELSLKSSPLHLEFIFIKIGTFRLWPYIHTVDFSLAGWSVWRITPWTK